jgi:hypothetical protein
VLNLLQKELDIHWLFGTLGIHLDNMPHKDQKKKQYQKEYYLKNREKKLNSKKI